MSKFMKEPLYNKRGLQNQWINLIYQSHDLICGCNKPIDHLKDIIEQQQCRPSDAETTIAAGGTGEDPEPTFDAGDLERLFSPENDVDEG